MNARVWAERLRGLQFSPTVIAIYAVSSFLGALIAFSSNDARNIGTGLLVSGLVTVFVVVVLWLLRAFVIGSSDIRIGWFVFISLGVGITRGLFMVTISVPLDLLPTSKVLTQILNSAVSAAVWLLLAALLLAGRERYRRQFRSLLVQGATQLESNTLVDADWDKNPSIIAMRENLAPHVLEVGATPDPESLMRTSEAIKVEIETNLRPLSHRLWFGSFDEYPHARLSRLVLDSIAGFKPAIWSITAAWVIGGLVGGPMLFGTERGVLATLISGAVLAALLSFFHFLARGRPSLSLGLVYLGVCATAPLVIADVVLRLAGFDSEFTVTSGLLVLLPVALLAVIGMGLAIPLANADRNAVLSIAQRYALSSISGLTNSLQVSSYIHNTLQAEFTGVSLQLKRAAETGDAELSRVAMKHAQELISRSVNDHFATTQLDPRSHAQSLVRGWRGICELSIQISDTVAGDPRGSIAVQAVEEFIANAVRHAGATNIGVTLESASGGIVIRCHVNREWQARETLGLGTRWFETLAPGGIRVSEFTGRCEIELVIE